MIDLFFRFTNKVFRLILPEVLRPLYLWNLIKAEMPLTEVNDYETYWQERIGEGRKGTLKRAELLSSTVKGGDMLLDIGCGDGEFLQYFKERSVDVTGIEISERAIDECHKKGIPAHKMNLLDQAAHIEGMYDYITILCLLEHVQDPEIMICKTKGHFRKGVIVAIPNIGFLPYRLRLVSGKFPIASIFYHVREHIRFWTVRDFKYWSEHFGFKVVRILPNTKGWLAWKCPSLFSSNIIYILESK